MKNATYLVCGACILASVVLYILFGKQLNDSLKYSWSPGTCHTDVVTDDQGRLLEYKAVCRY